jgi:ABC-type tungstate transport system permease subunit
VFHWIAGHEYQFISRADQSGTHLREQQLWRLLDQSTDRPWYRRLGGAGASGGGTATAIAEVRGRSAFTIADRLAVGEQAGVRVVQLDGREAENQFSLVTPADPAPGRHHALAFLSWITTESARTIIRRYGAEPSA